MLSLKGMKYMDKKRAILSEKDGKDILTLYLKSGSAEIDFNNSDQSYLRKVFYLVIENILEEDFEFEFVAEEGYEKKLYIEIAQEYIKQLNSELKSIKESAKQDFKDINQIS